MIDTYSVNGKHNSRYVKEKCNNKQRINIVLINMNVNCNGIWQAERVISYPISNVFPTAILDAFTAFVRSAFKPGRIYF